MKVEKLVRITAKSACMDIEVLMMSKKATAYVKRLNRLQKAYLDSMADTRMETYGKWWQKKTRLVKFIPDTVDQKIEIRIEPAGEILN